MRLLGLGSLDVDQAAEVERPVATIQNGVVIMKVTVLYGSPRAKSNSAALADHFVSQLEKKGATVDRYYLNKMKYRGCQGCMGCKNGSERCVLNDDLSPALDGMKDTDVLVLASSVYYGDVTSQMKGFIDRIYSFLVPEFWTKKEPSRLPHGKKLVFVLTQGDVETMYDDIYGRYNPLISKHGFDESHLLRVWEISQDQNVLDRKDVLQAAEELAQKF